MENLWLVAEVHRVINSGVLQQPVYGHVVQAVCVEMCKMYLCTCVRGGRVNNKHTVLLKQIN